MTPADAKQVLEAIDVLQANTKTATELLKWAMAKLEESVKDECSCSLERVFGPNSVSRAIDQAQFNRVVEFIGYRNNFSKGTL